MLSETALIQIRAFGGRSHEASPLSETVLSQILNFKCLPSPLKENYLNPYYEHVSNTAYAYAFENIYKYEEKKLKEFLSSHSR